MSGALAGAKAVVTGASGGIGGAIASMLAKKGVEMICLARRPPDVTRETAGGLSWRTLDLADNAAVEATAEALARELPELDLLIHAAGYHDTGPIADAPLESPDRMWRINLRAPWALTKELAPALSRRGGQIVFVNSSIWFGARAGVGGYSATKFALKALADALRAEINPNGVRVLSVFPGRTATRMQENIHKADGVSYRPERLIQPDDVAYAVLSMLSLPPTAELTELYIRPALKP